MDYAIDPPPLEELVRLGDLQGQMENVFPTRGSLEWELKCRRDAYIERGALVEIAGRMLAHPARFKRIAVELAQERTLRRVRA